MTRKLFHAGHDHDESEVETKGESFVLPFKILSAVVVFFVTILVFFSGKIIKRKLSVSPLLICYIECMCAGLYLGFGVCHMLPDSAYIFQNMGGRVPQANPSYVLFLFGFFVIMCIERIMTNKMMKTEQKEVQFDNSSMIKPETELTITNSDCSCYTSSYIENNLECKNAVISSFHHHYAHDENRSKVLSIALLVSLCFHGIFEGIAIGIQNDTINLVIFVVAMMIHKCGEAFGMGISFAKLNAKPRVWISAIIFSIMIPTFNFAQKCFRTISDQLVFRFALDGLNKTTHEITPSLFFGSAVCGLGEGPKKYQFAVLPVRENH